MTNETLFKFAQSQGHKVLHMNLTQNKAITIEQQHYCIILANNLTRTEEKELAAHELGHCEYGGTYFRTSEQYQKERAEYRANKWAYYQLVSPDEITECVSHGIVTPWELADYFEVSNEFMNKALGYYRMVGVA